MRPVRVSHRWLVSRIIPSGSAVQGTCGTELDGVAVVVFAFDEGLFGLFAAGDVDQRDGDADDLIGLVAGGLIGDEKGAYEVRLMRIGTSGFEFAVTLALE